MLLLLLLLIYNEPKSPSCSLLFIRVVFMIYNASNMSMAAPRVSIHVRLYAVRICGEPWKERNEQQQQRWFGITHTHIEAKMPANSETDINYRSN